MNPQEVKPSNQRRYLFNLVISPTSPSRKLLSNLLQTPAAIQEIGSDHELFIHVTPQWKKDAESKGFIKPDEYRRVLLDSKFTLCPSGHNPEAFRLYEAFEAGSIPIIALDDEYRNHGCTDSFAPMIETGAPMVILKNWNELPARIAQLAANPDKVAIMQEQLERWNSNYWYWITFRFECMVLTQHFLGKIPDSCSGLPFRRQNLLALAEQGGLPFRQQKLLEPAEQGDTGRSFRSQLPYNNHSIPLVTGCARSGTLSVSEYLDSIGIHAIHENVKENFVSVSWLYAVKDKKYPFESSFASDLRSATQVLLNAGQSLFSPVVHIVRHPLKVISSTRRCFCGTGDRTSRLGKRSDEKSWIFADKHIDRMNHSLGYSSIKRSVIYWVEWNKLIDQNFKHDQQVMRIEDLDPVDLVKAIGEFGQNKTEIPHRIPPASRHVSPGKEKTKLPDVTWEDIYEIEPDLALEAFQLAREYGYYGMNETLLHFVSVGSLS